MMDGNRGSFCESTYSAVICVTSGKEVKPEPMKESLYWVIFSAASQSSTELSLLRSGAARSNKEWWEGLRRADFRRESLNMNCIAWAQRRDKERVCVCKWVCISAHPGTMLLVPALRDAGLRIILSNMLTISGNFGRAFLSFCQQSSMSWCSTIGQSMGAGSLKSCSMAFITWGEGDKDKKRAFL